MICSEVPVSAGSGQSETERERRGESEGLGAMKEPEILTYLGMITLEIYLLTASLGGEVLYSLN